LRVAAAPAFSQTLFVKPADVVMRNANGSLELSIDLT
jgi:hypothetical protein